VDAAVSPPDPPTDPPTEPPADTVAPTVEIASPTDGGVVVRGLTFEISWSAGDDVGVTRVVVSVNGSVVCTRTTAVGTCWWTPPKAPGKRILITVTATDAAGNTATDRATVTTARR
jgi:Bacterial Ig domain